MSMDISTTYGAPGVSTATSGMGGMGGDDEVSAMIKELVRRRMAPAPAPVRRPSRTVSSGPARGSFQPQQRATNTEQGYVDPLAALKAQDQYDRSLMSAAMRPTGLGAQMIPGMAVDPRLLPPRLRPQSSSFAGPMGPSAAGLSNAPEPTPGPSSNSGFDYLSPIDRARAMAAAQRGR